MTVKPEVLIVELVMSIDRMIESAKLANPPVGEWNASTLLGHVSQVDLQVWLPRVEMMLAAQSANEAEPSFTFWEPDPIETARIFESMDIEDAAGVALQARTKLVTYLSTLTANQWDARANHATFGSMDVRDLIFKALTHDEEHRASLL
jgi:hypothetical protein